jgi:hypothetical protein
LETNFFPGRSFNSLDDLNNQAYDWACNRFANRPLSLTKLIPIELFEFEKNRLIKLNQNLMPPYLSHNRLIDQYGYIAFNGNYYWVPDEADDKKNTGRNVLIIEYPDKINIYQNHRILTSYPLPDDNVRNKKNSTRKP